MLYQEKHEVIGNHIKITIKYIREKWHEWLWIYISEGEACPYFYLPIYRNNYRRGYVAWFCLFAPFVLIGYSLYLAVWQFFKDCAWALTEWRELKRQHEIDKESQPPR